MKELSPRRVPIHGALLGCTAFISAFGVTTAAFAQDANTSSTLEEVVVTAQKREQNLQDVPIAVTAVTGERLAANRVQGVADLNGLAPGLVVRQTAGTLGVATLGMRGLNSLGSPGLDREISIYLDGVTIGQSWGANFDLPDIERIEVLRGPQGTLFGRNATAGAINIITRDPTGTFGVKQRLTYGNYDQFRSSTSIDLPAVGPFSGYVTYLHDERRGATRNLSSGHCLNFTGSGVVGPICSAKYLGDKKVDSWFAAAKFAPTQDFSVVYKFNYTLNHFTPPPYSTINYNPNAPTFGAIIRTLVTTPTGNSGAPFVLTPNWTLPDALNNGFAMPGRQSNSSHSLTAEWQATDNITVKNIFGYNKSKIVSILDLTGLGGISFAGGQTAGFLIDNAGNAKGYSNETQVNYESKLLTLTVGALYYHIKEEAGSLPNIQNNFIFSLLPASGLVPLGNGSLTTAYTTSVAAYTQAEFHVTPQLDVVGGYRITRDKKNGNYRFGATFVPSAPGSRTGTYINEKVQPFYFKKTRPSYALGVNYRPVDDILLYAKYSTAFVSGGAIATISFEPETAESWEAGVKADLLNRRLRINATVYKARYENQQRAATGQSIGRPDLATVVVSNGTQPAKGVEMEVVAAPTRGVTLGGSLSYIKTKYSNPNPALVAGAGGTYLITQVPTWTGGLWGQYETQPVFDDAVLSFRVDGSWRSKLSFTTNPNIALAVPIFAPYQYAPPRWLVNARIALKNIKMGPTTGEVAVWARNLTDNRDATFAVPLDFAGLRTTQYESPRTVGIDLNIDF